MSESNSQAGSHGHQSAETLQEVLQQRFATLGLAMPEDPREAISKLVYVETTISQGAHGLPGDGAPAGKPDHSSGQSSFLSNLHYFFAQTDGSYRWPAGSVGDLLRQAKREIEHKGEPAPMILHCPMCGMQHIDSADPMSETEGWLGAWTNPPHRSHLCHGCGTIWRPADVPTVGVSAISTCGNADNWAPSTQAATTAPDELDDADPIMALSDCANLLESSTGTLDASRCEVAARNARAAIRLLTAARDHGPNATKPPVTQEWLGQSNIGSSFNACQHKSYCLQLQQKTQSAAQACTEPAVCVCPIKDSVCGDHEHGWCDECPKRKHRHSVGGFEREKALELCAQVERQIMEVASGERKPGKVNFQPVGRLIEFIRNGKTYDVTLRATTEPESERHHPDDDGLLKIIADIREAAAMLAPGVADDLLAPAIGGPSEVPPYIEAVITALKSGLVRAPEELVRRIDSSIAWLERGELLPGSAACISLQDIKALRSLLTAPQAQAGT